MHHEAEVWHGPLCLKLERVFEVPGAALNHLTTRLFLVEHMCRLYTIYVYATYITYIKVTTGYYGSCDFT